MSVISCAGLTGPLAAICGEVAAGQLAAVTPVASCFNASAPLGYTDVDGSCAAYSSGNEKLAGMLGDQNVVVSGDAAWMLIASAFVMIMTPGLGLFYAGLAGAENAGNTLLMCFSAMALVSVQWFLIGYGFAFGHGTVGWGGVDFFALMGIGANPSGGYGSTFDHIIFVAFQGMFAQITPALIAAAAVGRMKFSVWCIFVLIWTTIVYDPITHWVWAFDIDATTGESVANGFLGILGTLDFAGGTVIHISSGFASLAVAWWLGPRKAFGQPLPPHNTPMVIIGATFLWFGWFGFNAGSAVAANGGAANAFANTHIAASCAAISWMIVEKIFDSSPTAAGAASGIVAGLVAITPACGFVLPWHSVIIGFLVSPVCFGAIKLKTKMGIDDTLDCWGLHGMGGVFGAIMTSLFAEPSVSGAAGAFYGYPLAIGHELAAICTSAVYSFVVTLVIIIVLDKTIGARVTEEQEEMGLDAALHGEAAYTQKTGAVEDDVEKGKDGETRMEPATTLPDYTGDNPTFEGKEGTKE